ncbi:MAG: hypothetical protein UH249_05530 [Acutalibacteraceae bacterium]|nr:hypothetical protein [Acutalibacteraceae bacterium]
MKKVGKKLLALILTLAFVVSSFAFVASTSAAEDTGTDIPLIYVVGTGVHLIADNPDGTTRKIFPLVLPENFIMDTVEANIGIFAKAVVTQQWDEFCDVLYDTISPLYADLMLDENGDPRDNSRADIDSRDRINPAKVNGKYGTEQFKFNYDWRIDPYVTAEKLHEYIEAVLAATGETEVALLGRCLGDCIAAAYMEKYDGEYVADYISYASAVNGAEFCSKAFCGEIYLEADGIERYVYDLELATGNNINEIIQAFVTVLNETYGLDFLAWSVNNVYPDIYLKIVPRLLRSMYGNFPAYWAMVSDEDYEKAKETVFYGEDTAKYANFINRIDNYHYNVQVKLPELWAGFKADGINMANVTKYGYQTLPIIKNADVLGEDFCTVKKASLGATTSTIDSVLSDDYIAAAQANGTDRYISPDKQIDASTCVLPDTTWFIKNMKHANFPDSINRLFDRIINIDGFTVFNDADYPQYLVFDDETQLIYPMTSDNMNTTERYNPDFFEALKKVFEFLFNLIKDAISGAVNPAPTE